MAVRLLFAGMDGVFDEVRQDDGKVGAEGCVFLGDDGFDRNGNVQGFCLGQIRRQGSVDQGILTILFLLGLINWVPISLMNCRASWGWWDEMSPSNLSR